MVEVLPVKVIKQAVEDIHAGILAVFDNDRSLVQSVLWYLVMVGISVSLDYALPDGWFWAVIMWAIVIVLGVGLMVAWTDARDLRALYWRHRKWLRWLS